MSNNPEDIKRDIEATREDLSRNVDALTEKVSPARVMEHRVDKAKQSISGVRDTVMGSASSANGGGGLGFLSGTAFRCKNGFWCRSSSRWATQFLVFR